MVPTLVEVWRTYLWVTDQLPVELRIKRLHVQTVDVQHRVPDHADL